MTWPALRARLLAVRAAALEGAGRTGSSRWRRTGRGEVTPEAKGPWTIEWGESGEWSEDGASFAYHTRLRWSFLGEAIELSHLRRGPAAPVHLATLTLNEHGALIPRAPHLCGDDQYLAEIGVDPASLTLAWCATGPAKEYRLVTTYR